jgi:oligoribonuclease NrnB/cAMP/cGMP phosphodiesterase (DHH superfamily)
MTDRPLVIYHGNCDDGFGAAYAAWLYLKDNADYYPGVYNTPPPDVTGREVYILDFSYKRETMQRIIASAKHVSWLDHHKTAFEEWLGEVPYSGRYEESNDSTYILLDNHHSGAMLAWEKFRPDAVIPPYLICHIEDNDLWWHKNPSTRPFIRRLRSEPQSFARWHQIAGMREVEYKQFVVEGEAIERFFAQQMSNIIDTCARPCKLGPLFTGLGANANYLFASELAGQLAERSGTFGLAWFQDSSGVIRVSLRSRGDYDVSRLAKHFGGGGHKNAAGFETTPKKIQEFFDA